MPLDSSDLRATMRRWSLLSENEQREVHRERCRLAEAARRDNESGFPSRLYQVHEENKNPDPISPSTHSG